VIVTLVSCIGGMVVTRELALHTRLGDGVWFKHPWEPTDDKS
jgi:hypothetical protein